MLPSSPILSTRTIAVPAVSLTLLIEAWNCTTSGKVTSRRYTVPSSLLLPPNVAAP